MEHFEGPSSCCLLRGTHVLTQAGETYVEYLRIGDGVRTFEGSVKPIRWIGRRSYSGIFAPHGVRPVCIRAGALARDVPERDLYVSPDHALYIDPQLVRAADLVNGISILSTEDSRAAARIDYYHLDLGGHEVIFAEGAAVESFIEEPDRAIFHNAGEYRALYPEVPIDTPARYPPRAEGFGSQRCAPDSRCSQALQIPRTRRRTKTLTPRIGCRNTSRRYEMRTRRWRSKR